MSGCFFVLARCVRRVGRCSSAELFSAFPSPLLPPKKKKFTGEPRVQCQRFGAPTGMSRMHPLRCGRDRFGPNPFLANVCVFVVSQFVRPRRVGPNPEKVGPEGWGRRVGGPKFCAFFPSPLQLSFVLPSFVEFWARRTAPSAGRPLRRTAQNIALFFLSPAGNFILSVFLWGSTRGILMVFLKAGALKMCTFGLSGCRVKPRRPARRGDFTQKWPNEAPTRTLCGIRPRTAFTINSTRRTPREGSQNENEGGRGRKESEILGGLAEGGPPEGGENAQNTTRNRQHATHATHAAHTAHTTHVGRKRIGQKWTGQKCHWPKMADTLNINFGQNGLAKIGRQKHDGQKRIGQNWTGQSRSQPALQAKMQLQRRIHAASTRA